MVKVVVGTKVLLSKLKIFLKKTEIKGQETIKREIVKKGVS